MPCFYPHFAPKGAMASLQDADLFTLKALQEKKFIRRVGSDRKGRWEVLLASSNNECCQNNDHDTENDIENPGTLSP